MAAELGESRGLPPQSIDVDRRHAALSFNNAGLHFINGTLIIGGEIMVPVNGFHETKDKRWMCFKGAYPHLRDGILQYFDAPHTQEALIHQVAKHESAKIESDFEALGLCAAPVMSPEEWLAHPQGKVMASQPIILTKQYGDAKQRQLSDASHRPLEAYG